MTQFELRNFHRSIYKLVGKETHLGESPGSSESTAIFVKKNGEWCFSMNIDGMTAEIWKPNERSMNGVITTTSNVYVDLRDPSFIDRIKEFMPCEPE